MNTSPQRLSRIDRPLVYLVLLAALSGTAGIAQAGPGHATDPNNLGNALPGNDDEAVMLLAQASARSLPAGPAGAHLPTRQVVREQLARARQMGTLTPSGEIGGTPEILAVLEFSNASQAETIDAEQRRTARTANVAASSNAASTAPAPEIEHLLASIEAAQAHGDTLVPVIERTSGVDFGL
ncbi:MAG: hypothetical protein LH480_06600 [Rubrivivax sp.]|nr:hypothetical protein [Rubrivivax sp.]